MNDQFIMELKQYLEQYSVERAYNMPEESRVLEEQFHSQIIISEPVKADMEYPKTCQSHNISKNISAQNPMKRKLAEPMKEFTVSPSERDIEEFIKNSKSNETFSSRVLKYIDQTGLPDSEIYKQAGIDRRHFSKIRCDKDYRPKKSTVVSLCLALRLGLDQVEELLQLSGYSLSNSDTGDLIVKFCIMKEKYNLMEVNEVLEYFGAKTLGV